MMQGKLIAVERKVMMQGKLIAVAYTLETSSLWAEFVKNRCISVRLVPEEVKELF